jgi:hypothetical protein
MTGWCGRTSRTSLQAPPHRSESLLHSSSATSAGPMIDAQIRSGPANSVQAFSACSSAFTGTRLDPAWHSARSRPPRSYPQMGHPRLACSNPAARTREATKTFSIGLVDSSRIAAGRSLRFSTRTEPSRALRVVIVLATLRIVSAD